MKKFILSILIFFFGVLNSYSHIDHYSNFNYLEYELFRNNKLIGFHKYDFIRSNGLLTVKSDVQFKITKLGVDLYKYKANSEEIYKKGNFFKF